MAFGLLAALVVLLALAFAVSIGAHYTGACMGMPFAAGVFRERTALLLMAGATLLGAALASGPVVANVGLDLLAVADLPLGAALAIVLSAFLLTTAYNFVAVPTSTIQILVFSIVGAGLGAGITVHWGLIEEFLVIWAVAPVAAFGIGFALTKAGEARRDPTRPAPSLRAAGVGALLLGAVGIGASFAMGANDVANATAVFLSTHLGSAELAGIAGGAALAVGVLTWGRRLLRKVAFDLVELDVEMATAAQFAQAAVVLASVLLLGIFTSLNQALVGGMTGAGVARQRNAVRWSTIRGVFVGWAIGPVSGLLLGLALIHVVALLGITV
jgi:PiT family inorganic phosphate transporter